MGGVPPPPPRGGSQTAIASDREVECPTCQQLVPRSALEAHRRGHAERGPFRPDGRVEGIDAEPSGR